MRFIIIFSIFFITKAYCDELIKPAPSLLPEEVISIQLTALKDNNNPYFNAGIEQTWEFAHPQNKMFTGPLSNFSNMMYSKYYSTMLNHKQHQIIPVKNSNNISYFFVKIIDKYGIEYGFQWTVQKVTDKGDFYNCWMTIGVSQPMKISNSA